MSTLFLALAALLILDYAVDAAAEWLNLSQPRDRVPADLADAYPAERFRQSVDYLEARARFGLLRRGVALLALLCFIAAGGLDGIDRLARAWSSGEIVTGLIFFGLLAALQWVASLPFSLWSVFRIEERFGFNRMSAATFWGDQLKGMLLALILGAPALAGVLALFGAWGGSAWLYAWLGLTAFQLFLAFVAPAWILPLFNRFEPLPPGELREAIERYARSQDFALEGIYTMDGSRRSTKSNAFFTGFGRFRRLVFFDTLIKQHPVPELLAVLAHEIGHYRLRHIPRMLALSIAVQGALFYAFGRLLGQPALFEAFRVENTSVYASLLFVAILYAPVSRLLGVLSLGLSRRYEYQADAFAARTTGRGEDMIAALRRLSADNLSDLLPHPLKVALDYSHPPILKRIEALRSLRREG
jgi:STE24 endopeptidase